MRLAELSPIGERVTLDTLHLFASPAISIRSHFILMPKPQRTAFLAHFAHLDGTLVQAG